MNLQAEAVAQLVGARSVAAADSALAGLKGGIGSAIASLRLEALTLLADIEVPANRNLCKACQRHVC